MELRVWVDGTQRVVCGVKLTTTCQEIVFALAHATQQAGRFTMIERWRNNERLLSPNEQPLVTLQRWGDHMNEVEFILRKTSTDVPSGQPANQLTQQQVPIRPHSEDAQSQHQVSASVIRESPRNSANLMSGRLANEHSMDNAYHHQYNLNRRPQTVLGPLTTSHSVLGLSANYLQPPQQTMARMPHLFRPSISASALPSTTDCSTASTLSTIQNSHPRYNDDKMLNHNSSAILRHPNNGYTGLGETQIQQNTTSQTLIDQSPHEVLYSTINKKRNNQPPAVPAKPQLPNQISSTNNMMVPQQQLPPINNAQMNFFHANHSPHNFYSSRPRHPPEYLDYLEAMANRNPMKRDFLLDRSFSHRNRHPHGHLFQGSTEPQILYGMQRSEPQSLNSNSVNNHLRYPIVGQADPTIYHQGQDTRSALGLQGVNPARSKLIDSGLVINRGSAINVKLPSNSQNLVSHSLCPNDRLENVIQDSNVPGISVSQLGRDMLKVIEEQKKVLMNQKSELDRLDKDREYWDSKQTAEQAELIDHIESEIHQLEELWKENQMQIRKLENQDFEKELQELKSEQARMESEISRQKGELSRCENEISQCKDKIQQLEAELAELDAASGDSSLSSDGEYDLRRTTSSKSINSTESLNPKDGSNSFQLSPVNGSAQDSGQLNSEIKSSEDEDDGDNWVCGVVPGFGTCAVNGWLSLENTNQES